MTYDPKTAWSILQPADLPPEAWAAMSPNMREWLKEERIYMNHLYQVNVRVMPHEDERLTVTHLSIKLRTKDVVKDWRHFQLIKNQLCGKESCAIEIYPPESKLVDTSNQYHLWVFPNDELFPFMFQERLVSEGDGIASAIGSGSKQRPFEIRADDTLQGADLDAMIKKI